MSERYTHGHHPAVLAAHGARTAQNSAAFLLPHLRPDHHVLDVGCGPGSITVDLAELVPQGRVVGIDAVASVLEQGRATATARGVPNVTFETADTYALPYPEDSFDVVYAHQVLQHVARPVEALREMRRVLRPGGLVAVRDSDYSTMIHAPHDARLDRWLELYFHVARSNGGEPNAGRFLRGWVQQAEFVNEVTTGSAWCHANAEATTTWGQTWAARVTESAFAEQAVAMGAATVGELADIADAWRSWAAKPDAFFAFVHGEVIAAKA